MRHDCLSWTCGGYHPELLGPSESIGRSAYGTVPAKARRRAANRRARAARRAAR